MGIGIEWKKKARMRAENGREKQKGDMVRGSVSRPIYAQNKHVCINGTIESFDR